MSDLASLYAGFRERYLKWEALEGQLQAWAQAFPDLVRLESLGTTDEGRELWVMTIGPDPDRLRPAVWVDGNMHASEVCGSSVVLAFVETLLRLHLEGDTAGLPEHLAPVLQETLVYAMPRISPDGAEAVLRDGRYVRSVPRDNRPNKKHARWVARDIDGDGRALVMRKEDPTGEYVASDEVPGLMLPRGIFDEGPFYKIWPEGVIENFDGVHIPEPSILSDNQTDLNRNFPWSWAPDHQQLGAGAYPLSETESRAVVDFTAARPHIYGWINFHTFGGVFIRPMGHEPDSKMHPSDLALYRQLGHWAEELTGYPMVSGFQEFLYEPDKPLHGDLSDYAYMQRGAVAWVVELHDLFAQLGIERKKPFVDHYAHITREQMVALGTWDREHNASRTLVGWTPAEHPQLGAVECGGIDPRVGMWNPPYEQLPEVCEKHAAMCLRLVALAPRLALDVNLESHGDDRHLVTLTVRNTGYLPTNVLESARALSFNEPVWAEVETAGCSVADASRARVELGHLAGWGRGRFGGAGALFFQRSAGSVSTRQARWLIEGRGTVLIKVGSCRTGEQSIAVDVG